MKYLAISVITFVIAVATAAIILSVLAFDKTPKVDLNSSYNYKGAVRLNGNKAMTRGSGFEPGVYEASYERIGDLIHTSILIDLNNLTYSADGDIIGTSGGTNCHFGQYKLDTMGNLVAGSISYFKTLTGLTTLDIYGSSDGTQDQDDAVSGEALYTGSAITGFTREAFTTMPTADHYLYLVGGASGSGTYASSFPVLIEFWGYA